jgi:phosphotriesterase-related protein
LLGLGAGIALFDGLDLGAVPQGSSDSKSVVFPKGSVIRAVLKDLDPSTLTTPTLYHEHVSITDAFLTRLLGATAKPGSPPPPPRKPGYTDDRDLMVAELEAARKDAVACLVDAGSASRRSVDYLKELSAKSGMPIVAGGGYYLEPVYPPEVSQMTEEQLVEGLVRDAGAQRWGAFGEIGSTEAFTPLQRKAFRAMGKAQVRTNLPILTHTPESGGGSKVALEQLDIFESVGVSPRHVAIGHLDGAADFMNDVRMAIAKRGAYVGLDHTGRGATDPTVVPMVLALINAGYADNILLSSDFASEADLKRNGGPGYAKTITVFVPLLRKAGVSETTIHSITVDNPRRFLAFVPKKA